VNSLAVSSTGTFWSGDEFNHWYREFEKRRAELQQCGTRAAHNALLRVVKRERAWRKQYMYIHTVANDIVTEAIEYGCDVVVFEDLTDIRERLPHTLTGIISGHFAVLSSTSNTSLHNGVSRLNRLPPVTPANGVLTPTVGFPTKTTATASSSGASNVGTNSMRTTTARKTSGWGICGSDNTARVPRPRRGTQTHE